MAEDQQWYYCLDHKTVETKDGCRSINRFGPYSTREDAQRAMEKVAERNEEADRADREWDEPDA
jgi:hypothetical protein